MRILHVIKISVGLVTLAVNLPACDPPTSTMKDQPKAGSLAASSVFLDGGASQPPPRHTVGRYAEHDGHVPTTASNSASRPRQVRYNMSAMLRGQRQFATWCSPCHGLSGYGDGMVVRSGFPPPTSFHIERVREMVDEEILDVIRHGRGKMPAYGPYISPTQRAEIVAYVRALQLSQHAPEKFVAQYAKEDGHE